MFGVWIIHIYIRYSLCRSFSVFDSDLTSPLSVTFWAILNSVLKNKSWYVVIKMGRRKNNKTLLDVNLICAFCGLRLRLHRSRLYPVIIHRLSTQYFQNLSFCLECQMIHWFSFTIRSAILNFDHNEYEWGRCLITKCNLQSL